MVLSPDGETEFFNILAGVLQCDTLAPYRFVIIIINYVMRSSINGREAELGFQLHPWKIGRVPATYLTDLDFAQTSLCYQQNYLKRRSSFREWKTGQ